MQNPYWSFSSQKFRVENFDQRWIYYQVLSLLRIMQIIQIMTRCYDSWLWLRGDIKIWVIQKIWKSVNLGFSINSLKMSKLDKNDLES